MGNQIQKLGSKMKVFKINEISGFGGFLKVKNRLEVRAVSGSRRPIGCPERAIIGQK
tara:strand:+ start:1607 stop:1777 length:171 start_codon:yes stop_codon:yes gene_type:complete